MTATVPLRAHVLARDPGLLEGLDPADARAAVAHAPAPVLEVPAGASPEACPVGERDLGLLVLDGLLLREVQVGASRCCELVGRGDLIRPGDEDLLGSVHARTAWRAQTPVQLALLDEPWEAAVARWPVITVNLVRRTIQRAHSLALYLAISHVTGVDARVLSILWHFADRWGRVTPEGTVLPLRLTHELLGAVVGARRQSVSAAIGDLERRGAISRARDGSRWVLREPPPEVRA